MSRERVLILESNPTSLAQMTDVLSRSGWEAYSAEDQQAVQRALNKGGFSLVIADTEHPRLDAASFASAISSTFPSVAIVFTGRDTPTGTLLGVMRNGADDFLPKPFDPRDFVTRIASAVSKRRTRAQELDALRKRAETALSSAATTRPVSAPAPLPRDQILRFIDDALNTFVSLERENIQLRRELQSLRDPSLSSRMNRKLSAWIAHADADFRNGLWGVGGRINVTFDPPMTTGSEVLDRLGASPADIILLGDTLDDLPGTMVADMIRSQHPASSVILIHGWATPAVHAELLGSGSDEPLRRPLRNLEDLVAVIEAAKDRCYEADLGREFALQFKERHDEFLKTVATVRGLVAG